MALKDTYGLPDSTLQLIAGSPEMSIPMQQGTAAQFASPDVRRSDLISALRGISGPANPGFTRYANGANSAPLTLSARKPLNVISPARLTLSKAIAPEVTLPGAEPPYIPPYVPPYVPPFVDKVIVDDIVDDDVVDDDVVDDTVVDDTVVDDTVVDDTVIDDDIVDDDVEGTFDLDLDTDLSDVLVPEEKEKTGFVDMEVVDGLDAQDDGTTDGILDLINAGFGGSEKTGIVDIEPVDIGDAQDDGTTDDILELINYLNSMPSGGGKSVFDETSGVMEF